MIEGATKIAYQQCGQDRVDGDNNGGSRSSTNVQDIEEGEKNVEKINKLAPRSPLKAPHRRFVASLPTLDETETAAFQENIPSIGYLSDSSSKKTKKTAKKGKTNRMKQLQASAQKEAAAMAQIGDEKEAMNVYENAIMIAGSEIGRIKFKIRRSQGQHEATRESIQSRLQEDLRKVCKIISKLRTKMAILYERSGDLECAIECCREANEVYKYQLVTTEASKQDKATDELIELMQVMIDRLTLAHKALAGRNALLLKIEELRREIAGTPDIAQKKKLYQEVEATANKVKKMERDALGDAHPQVADTLQLLSTIALEQNKHNDAIEYLQKAIKISKASLGMKHPRTGQYYLRLARIQLSQGIESLALKCFHEAADVLCHSQKFARVLGSTFNDVAVIYMRRREFDLTAKNLREALLYYDRALQQPCESEAGPQRCGLSIDSLQVFRNLGECCMKQQDFEGAREAFLKVLQLQRDTRKVYDTVKDLDLGILGVESPLVSLIDDESIADSLLRLGRATAAGEKHQEALTIFKDAMEVLNRIGIADALSKGFSGLSDFQQGIKKDQVTNTLYCIAEESSAIGEYDAAILAYGESMRLRCGFSFGRSQQEKQSSIVHCILCFVGIGNIHSKKQEDAAAYKVFNDTLSYCRENGLPTKHPLTTMIKQRLREIESKMANAETPKRFADLLKLEERAEQEVGREAYEQALATLTEILAMRRTEFVKLKASGEDTSVQIHGIARLLRSFGSVFARTGDDENADRAYKDAIRLFEKSGASENISI